MKLDLKKPIAIFDLETTGLNITQDRIVEIAIIKVHPNGDEEEFHSLVNPEIEIPIEISEIHHIYQEDIKDKPTFKEISEKVVEFIGDADLVGFNSNKFDIPVLSEELLRVGNNFDLSGKKFIDIQNIFHKMEQRTLSAAYKFYCQKEIENAHSALDDTRATWEVMKAQVEKYDNLENNVDFLSNFSKAGNNTLDFAGRLAINSKNEVVYNFGKNKGKTVKEISENEPGYYGWMMQADFPLYTKQCLKKEMNRIKSQKKTNNNSSNNLSLNEKMEALKNKFKS
jgi:DNA polymerase III subunit epsilon